MDLPAVDGLRCFLAGAQTLNFRSAARLVHLTPAAFGQRIKQLEEQLGAALFARTTRSVSLTAAGLALVPVARAALDALGECGRAARGERGPEPVELVLGTRHELGLSWVVPLLKPLAKALPHVTVHLYFGSGEDLLLRLRMRELDCAVTSTRVLDPRLDGLRLHQERYVFVGSRALLEQNPLKKPEDAARHTLVDATAELPLFRYWRDAPGGGDRLHFGRIVRRGTIAAIEHAVRSGEGVAVLPRYFVEPALERRALCVLFPKVEPQSDWFRLVFRADDPRRSLFEALSAELVRAPLR